MNAALLAPPKHTVLRSRFWLLALSAALASCAPPWPAQPLALPEYGLSVELPPGWTVQQNIAGLGLLLRPTRKGQPIAGAYLSLMRDVPRPGQAPSMANYLAYKLEQDTRNTTDYRLIAQQSLPLLGGTAQLRISQRQLHGRQAHTLEVFALAAGCAYTISASAPPAEFALLQASFRRVALSLRALDATGPRCPPTP